MRCEQRDQSAVHASRRLRSVQRMWRVCGTAPRGNQTRPTRRARDSERPCTSCISPPSMPSRGVVPTGCPSPHRTGRAIACDDRAVRASCGPATKGWPPQAATQATASPTTSREVPAHEASRSGCSCGGIRLARVLPGWCTAQPGAGQFSWLSARRMGARPRWRVRCQLG